MDRLDRPLLVAIRAVHSAIFLVELASIGWLLVTGLANRRDRTVAVAAGLVTVESAVFVLNDGVCPLTPLAERHGAVRGSVSDIFLPDVVARTIPIWSTALLAMAFVLHVHAWLRARARDRAGDVCPGADPGRAAWLSALSRGRGRTSVPAGSSRTPLSRWPSLPTEP